MNIERVWGEHRNRIHTILKSKVSRPEDVEDLLQDIVLKVYVNLNKINNEQSLKPWLSKVVSNSIIDYYRRKSQAMQTYFDFDFDTFWDGVEMSPEDSFSTCISPYMDKLPRDYVELLVAIEIYGLSQKEYAEVNKLSYSTVKSRVQTGKKRIRSLFERCCEVTLDNQGKVIECIPRSNCCN